MSYPLSPGLQNINNSPNTFSVLSSVTPNVQRPTVPVSSAVSLSNTPMSSASLTGLISPNSQIVSTSSPVAVTQTVNSPVIPTRSFAFTQNTTSSMTARPSPNYQSSYNGITQTAPVQGSTFLNQRPPVPAQSLISQPRSSPGIQAINNSQQINGRVSPGRQSLIPLTVVQQQVTPSPTRTPVQLNINNPSGSPSAISALSAINSGYIPPSPGVTIPTLTPEQLSQSVRQNSGQVFVQDTLNSARGIQHSVFQQESLLFPSIKVNTSNSSLPVKPTAELMNQGFEIRDYQGIIQNSSIENELLNAGYAPLSRIVVRMDNGDKRTQYIKAINKKGQKVFILLDVNGYTTARSTDLTLIEAHSASIVPYSLKTGAYECAGKDVCGVAFECGSDAVCVLSRGNQDLTPKEANFVFVEQKAPSAATIEIEGSIMTYPVIRLSEIRANPSLVLLNTDTVTRRLRNSSYASELQELAMTQQSINKVNTSFVRFNAMRERVAIKLNQTLSQLEQWNEVYMAQPPTSDEYKDKYRRLQYNLAQRNEDISTILRTMKKVADKRMDIDVITKEINDLTDFAEKEFANVEFATSD